MICTVSETGYLLFCIGFYVFACFVENNGKFILDLDIDRDGQIC